MLIIETKEVILLYVVHQKPIFKILLHQKNIKKNIKAQVVLGW